MIISYVLNKMSKCPLVGSDAVALFPSITAATTAEIVKQEILKSEIKFEGFDVERGRAYLAINKEEIKDLDSVEHLLPSRRAKSGITPTMASITSKWNPSNQWEFGEKVINDDETRLIIATVVEIAIKILFKNFTYKFGGNFYHQSEGGPIGVRATGAAANLVMENWADLYRKILEDSGLIIHILAGYVDDGRQLTSVFPME